MSEVQQIGNIVDDTNIWFKNPQRGRIYSADGVSPALNTKQGGGLEPKIVCCSNKVVGRNARSTMTKYIYLSGGMSNLSLDEQLAWRIKFQHLADGFYSEHHIECFIPPYYYNYEDKMPESEREAFEYDLYRLRHSDVMVANFNVPKSIGTAYEIAVARENRIPVVGINETHNEIHPWLVESCLRVFDTLESAAKYVGEYLI